MTGAAIDLGAHAGLIEALIALSIAYLAADALVCPKLGRTRWPEAFAFGLLHGRRVAPGAPLAPRWVRGPGLAILALLGLFWFFERL